jgi:hypothetical protein
VATPGCPRIGASHISGHVGSRGLDEISGLVASRAQPGMYWVHNDSGDAPRVYAIDDRGRLRLELSLRDVTAHDIEDIALVRSAAGGDILYLADSGDNLQTRAQVRIYRVAAPRLADDAGVQRLLRKADIIAVSYEDGPHDVEALLADPRSGDLYLIEKGPLLPTRHPVGVYRIDAAELLKPRVRARRIATVPLGPVTAADVLPDGSGLAVRNYTHARFWPIADGEGVAAALAREGCDLPLADLGEQGEALAFRADGTAYVTIAEGEGPPIHVTPFTRE